MPEFKEIDGRQYAFLSEDFTDTLHSMKISFYWWLDIKGSFHVEEIEKVGNGGNRDVGKIVASKDVEREFVRIELEFAPKAGFNYSVSYRGESDSDSLPVYDIVVDLFIHKEESDIPDFFNTT